MECRKIRKLLSEYAEGVLEEPERERVEKHLLACPACSEELASLKSYLKGIAAVERVKAPRDFLARVHARLERRFLFKKMLHELFIPVHLKIPLASAAVALTVLLVIYVVNVMQPAKQIEDAFTAPQPVSFAKQDIRTDLELALKMELEEGVTDSKGLGAPSEIEGEKPIELVLLIRPETLGRIDVSGGVLDEENKKVAWAPAAMKSRGIKEAEGGKETSGEEVERVKRAPPGEADSLKNRITFLPSSLSEALSGIKDLIKLLEGKVISVECEKETNLPQHITAEIPAANYSTFLEKLGQLGELQEPLPPEAPPGGHPITLRMNLISSN